MKNLGNAKYILGMCITHGRTSNGCSYLFQSEYISKILERFNIERAKYLSTLLTMHVNIE